MKKTISLFLVLALMLPCIFVHASAAGAEAPADDIKALACEVFPEYADVIQGENLKNNVGMRSVGERELVVCETREIADDHTMTYMQYSDGIAVIADELNPEEDFDDSTSTGSSGGSYTSYTSTLTVTVNFSSQKFKVTNLRYTIYTNSTDVIHGRGSLDTSNIYSASHLSSYNLNETSSTRAYCKYRAFFNPNPGLIYVTPFQVDITFSLRNNARRVEFNV